MGAIRTPYSLVNGRGEFAKGKVENTERGVTDKRKGTSGAKQEGDVVSPLISHQLALE
jgi:hypothetical protein